MALTVQAENPRAVALYSSLGWTTVAEQMRPAHVRRGRDVPDMEEFVMHKAVK